MNLFLAAVTGNRPTGTICRKSFRDEYVADLMESGELTMSLSETGAVIYRLET